MPGKVNMTYENDQDLMICFYKFVANEEMACDEAELGPDEFAERLRTQENLQEQVLSILNFEKDWKRILLKFRRQRFCHLSKFRRWFEGGYLLYLHRGDTLAVICRQTATSLTQNTSNLTEPNPLDKVQNGGYYFDLQFRQRGTKFNPGKNVGLGKDYTIFSLIDGLMKFEKIGPYKKKVSVYPRDRGTA
ncbi:hypothetical protein SLEP1_g56974 [Rubroshorea leprosula]|uniref:Uncharacterized protein n=1 Tax=Rubroshorea leprosula TaxID=152421 RepID=A0AAV5MPB4_9ROSI|nr:hypothetical protein SLEP1_g56974 [Rubroshorea leprosula]